MLDAIATPVSSDDDVELSEEQDQASQGHLEEAQSLTETDITYGQFNFIPVLDQNIVYFDGNTTGTYSGRVGTIVILSNGQSLALTGVYQLTVLRGSINMMGSVLCASSTSHPVFAPKCSPIPIIVAASLKDEATFPIHPFGFTHLINENSVVLLLEDVETGIEDIGRVCKIFSDAFNVQHTGLNVLRLSRASLVIESSTQSQFYATPGSWDYALSSIYNVEEDTHKNRTPVVFIHGPKRCGKSTLARFLCNRLLNTHQRVAYLECDTGQTEFTPPGLVSLNILNDPLFGPPFSHPSLSYASHYIGAASPQSCPSTYIESIKSLIQTYNNGFRFSYNELNAIFDDDDKRINDVVPLIVNTMGWTKGLGKRLVEEIQGIVEPTHIICIRCPTSDSIPRDVSDAVIQYLEVDPIPPSVYPSRYSSADWRALSLVSYFHCVTLAVGPPFQKSVHKWNFNLPLISQPPYQISIDETLDGIFLTGAGAEDVISDEIERVLNGALVALVSCDADSRGALARSKKEELPYIQGNPLPHPLSSNCVGLALIRGISPHLITPQGKQNYDEKHRYVHLLTPLAPDMIRESGVRCLVKGELEISIWCMLDHRNSDKNYGLDAGPFLQWRKEFAAGSERRRIRRNLMRRGQN